MPTSDLNLIPAVLTAVLQINPRSILDCGIGMGKYGCLLREYLDYAWGRFTPFQFSHIINGVEGFESYGNPNWNHYDSVVVENFIDHMDSYQGYNLVLAVDSLEHVPYEQGKAFILKMKEHNDTVLISTPAPQHYLLQGAVFGNELEVHRHQWTPQEFTALGGQHLYSGVCQLFKF